MFSKGFLYMVVKSGLCGNESNIVPLASGLCDYMEIMWVKQEGQGQHDVVFVASLLVFFVLFVLAQFIHNINSYLPNDFDTHTLKIGQLSREKFRFQA